MMNKKLHFFLFSLCVVTCVTLPKNGVAQDKDARKAYFSLSVENDNFGGGTDRFYTSGVRATWFDSRLNVPPMIDKMAEIIPTFNQDNDTSTFFSVGQNIYTPEDITVRALQDEDRPWAAFLYGSVGLANVTYHGDQAHHVDELEFTFGVVGPAALGKQAQRFVHENITNSPEPRGWKNQIGFEPGVILSWRRRFPYSFEHDIDFANFRIEPNIAVSLGNVRTSASAGAVFILASDRLLDTPPRVRPAIPGTGAFLTDPKRFNWQVFAGFDGRAVARDIFLDGNTFKDSDSVSKKNVVGDLSGGFSLFYDDYRLSYTINYRTKEFKTQSDESVFGSVTLTRRF